MDRRPPRSERDDTDRPDSERRREISSEALLGGSKELLIHHRGEAYRLRLTRQNKLILTK